MEAARELFFEQGYASTGISQILKRSGASSGSLYHFFTTKEDLLLAVLEKYKAMLVAMVLAPAFEQAVDPIERIFAILAGYRRLLVATDFRLGCPIGNLALEISNSHPAARKLAVENFDAWRQAVIDLIQQASDRMPADIDPSAISFCVLASMEGAVMLARAHNSIEPFDAAIDTFRDLFDRLLRDGTEWSHPKQSPKES